MALFKKRLKSGKVCYYLDLRDHMGRRFIRSLKTDQHHTAQQRFHEMSQRILAGRAKAGSVTLRELQTLYIDYSETFKSESAIISTTKAFEHFCNVLPETMLIDRVNLSTIDEFKHRLNATLSPSTVNTYSALLSGAWSFAVARDLVRDNPWHRSKRLDTTRTNPDHVEARYFTDDEREKIFSALANSRVKTDATHILPAAQVAYYTGLRLGEVVRLCPEHIGDRHIYVTFQTKGRTSRRVPLCKEVKALFSSLAANTAQYYFPARRDPSQPFSKRALSARFGTVCRQAGVVHGHFHMLRHTFAAKWLSAGKSILVLSRFLGHSSVRVTDEIYGHLIPGSQDHEIDDIF